MKLYENRNAASYSSGRYLLFRTWSSVTALVYDSFDSCWATINASLFVSAVNFAPYLTGLSSMMLI